MMEIFGAVLRASLWGGGLTLIFLAVNKIFEKKLPPSWHYYIWLAVLARLLLPVTFEIGLEAESAAPFKAINLPAGIERMIQQQEEMAPTEAVLLKPAPVERLSTPSDEQKPAVTRLPAEWLAYLWLGVALGMFGYKLISYNLYMAGLRKHGQKLRSHTSVTVIKSTEKHSPFAAGLIKPVVVLPDEEFPKEWFDYILSHEYNHIKRGDIVIKWLFELAKCIHWFNPMVYLAAKSADFYCDASCDQDILRHKEPEARKEYGLALLGAASCWVGVKTPTGTAMASGKSNLKKRIEAILNPGILNQGLLKRSLFLKTLIIMMVLSLCACSSLKYKIKEKFDVATEDSGSEDSKPFWGISLPTPFSAPVKTNFLIAGTDQYGALTDVIIAGSFDRNTKKLNLVSIPRDTRVELTDKVIEELDEKGEYSAPASGIMKMNSVNVYGGEKNGMYFLKGQVEQILGIKLDYYVKVDLDAFKKIVDAVGGVEMDIRPQGYYYWDPTQNLEINVPGGHQILTGEMAEGVVRFRSDYRNGDVDRIEVQHEFMRQFFSQVINQETIMNNFTSFLSVAINDVETDFGIGDIPKYVKYIKDISLSDINMETLPGQGTYIDGVSYFIPEPEDTRELVARIWGNQKPADKITEQRIQVLNGNGVAGTAARVRDMLEEKGYNVVDIGDYDGGENQEVTTILAKDKNDARKFTTYFKKAVAVKDEEIPEEFDVVIVVGKSEIE